VNRLFGTLVKSRGKDDTSIPGILDGPRGKYEHRLPHLDIELLRSCRMHVSSARVAEGDNANPYEAVKSNPTAGSFSGVYVLSPDPRSRPDLVSENSAETDKYKKITEIAKTARRRQRRRDVALRPSMASF
jgi:hypothetical protein